MTIFRVDDLYPSNEIQKSLKVGNAGGVRACLAVDRSIVRFVLMINLLVGKSARENPYHDRIEGDVLIYTGAGKQGDQTLGGINKRIPQQYELAFPIYGFEIIGSRRDKSIGPKRWRFLGLLEYLRHYPDTQIDASGSLRQVWLFEFRLHRVPDMIPVESEAIISQEIMTSSRANSKLNGDDREIETDENIQIQEGDPVAIESLRSRLLVMRPFEFEHLIKDLLIKTGFEQVMVTKYSQDGGIDVNAIAGRAMWPIENLLVQIQAKRWLHSVGRKEVAELRGSLQPFARGEQEVLIDTLRRRMAEHRRMALAKDIQEARKEFEEGHCQRVAPDELVKEILS